MEVPSVRVVASWDGWCGSCRTERPLVLTRTGRRGLRAWWAGVGRDELPLTLTCRLCGVGVDVPPHEDDDPEVVETADEPVLVHAAAPTVTVAEHDAPEQPFEEHPVAEHSAAAEALAALLRARAAAAVPASRPPVDDAPHEDARYETARYEDARWPRASEDTLDLIAAGVPALVLDRA